MDNANLFGCLALTFSILGGTVGLGTQVLKNYKNESCAGLSLTFFVLGFCSCSSWLGYGLSKPDIFLCLAQVPGFLFLSAILFQFYWYREPKEEEALVIAEAEVEADA